MEVLRYFRKGRREPDVVIIPVEHREANKDMKYLEKLVFYRDTSRKNARLLVVSKDIVKDAGGFDSSLGFGEDRIFQEKVFSLVGVNEDIRNKFKI